MALDSIIFLIILILSALTAAVVAYFLFERKRSPGANDYGLMLISVIVWIIGDIIEYYSPELNEKLLGLKIEYAFGIPYVSVFWFFAAVSYISLGKKPTILNRAALLIIPALTTFLMFTDGSTRLFYYNFRLIKYGPFVLLFKDWGVWFYINVGYSYLMLLCGTIVLLFSLKKGKLLYKKQVILILLSLPIPWIASILYVAGMKSFLMLDITPLTIIISVIIIGLSIFKYGMLDIIPAAHNFIVEYMDNALIVLDNKNRIVDANLSARKFFNNDKFIGLSINIFFEVFNINDEFFKSQNSISEVKIKDEIFNATSYVLFDKKKRQIGRIINFNNISALKKKENELSESNATKEKFFSIIAHDLKNPFFSILGLTEMLTSENEHIPEEDKKEIIKSIRNISVNTYDILENLLHWAYQSTGNIDFAPEIFDLYSLVDENISQVFKTAEFKKIKINSTLDKNCFVIADKNMVHTVIRNLISNAIKFSNHEGVITISSFKNGNFTFLSIEDNGVGIPPNSLENIFSVGKNNKSIGTAGEKGTGIGLPLCKEFVEKNGGNISVQSQLGLGSKFTFSLPSN